MNAEAKDTSRRVGMTAERIVDAAVELVQRLFGPLMRAAAQDGAALDWKTALQELSATRGLGAPDYRLAESGPDHAKSFTAVVHVGGEARGDGAGRSKKEAEQRAAEAAFGALSDDAAGTDDLAEGLAAGA